MLQRASSSSLKVVEMLLHSDTTKPILNQSDFVITHGWMQCMRLLYGSIKGKVK